MKTARIHSVCECQGRLGAEVDENLLALSGWVRAPRGGREVAPVNTTSRRGDQFDVGWFCPLCVRNTLRSFDRSGLVFREQKVVAASAETSVAAEA